MKVKFTDFFEGVVAALANQTFPDNRIPSQEMTALSAASQAISAKRQADALERIATRLDKCTGPDDSFRVFEA